MSSIISLPDVVGIGIINTQPNLAVPNSGLHCRHDTCLVSRRGPLIFGTNSYRKKKLFLTERWLIKRRTSVFSSNDDSGVKGVIGNNDGFSLGRNEMLDVEEDELMAAKRALSEAQARQEATEKERDKLLEELACDGVKQLEYLTTILEDKEMAVWELEAAKSLFNQKLQESVQEKSSLLVLMKQDAVELAVQVERLAEIAFQQATTHVLEDAQLRVAAAETTAEVAESLLLKERQPGDEEEDAIYVDNGGRIDLLTTDDSQKWKLLSDGPRRDIPPWMARRIRTKFPPRKVDVAEALSSEFRSLTKPEEVWSIALEEPKEGGTLVDHVFEKEVIEKKRKAVERVLERRRELKNAF